MDGSKSGKKFNENSARVDHATSRNMNIRLSSRKMKGNIDKKILSPKLHESSLSTISNELATMGTVSPPGQSTFPYCQHLKIPQGSDIDSMDLDLRTPTSVSSSTHSSTNSPVRLAKKKKTRIIPKVTLANQLLKSSATSSNETANAVPATNKSALKLTPKAQSSIWTQERLTLLNQITDDPALKAVLMSAGDKYWKTRNKLKTKPTAKGVSKPLTKLKETQQQASAKPPTQPLETTGIPSTVKIAAALIKKQPIQTSSTKNIITNVAIPLNKNAGKPLKPKAKVSFKTGVKRAPIKTTNLKAARKPLVINQTTGQNKSKPEEKRPPKATGAKSKARSVQPKNSSGVLKKQDTSQGVDHLKNYYAKTQ